MFFIAKITGATLNSTAKVYEYGFQQVYYNSSTGALVNGELSSGTGLKAVALWELGQDMTGQDSQPSVATDTYVLCVRSGMQVYIVSSAAGLKDVSYSKDDDVFYKTTMAGIKQVWAQSTLYPPTTTEE